jgi:hypothetical protein
MREASRFSTLLYQELHDFIEGGGRLAGGWGRMVAHGDKLILEIGPNPFLTESRAPAVLAEAMGSFDPGYDDAD